MHKASILATCLAAALAGCSNWSAPRIPGVTPYKMEIQQGNSVTQEMVNQLKPGMSREQVRFVLGTPLLTDIFHADRWDYVYWREQADGKRDQRKLAVFFKDGKLTHLDGDVHTAEPKPDEAKPAAESAAERKPAAETAKPAGETAKPAGETAKPAGETAVAPAQAGGSSAPAPQNWGTATQSQAEAKPEEKPAEAQKQPEESKKERGFFGRMLEKIGL